MTKAASSGCDCWLLSISGEEESLIRERLNEQYAHFKNILKSRILERAPGADGEQPAFTVGLRW
ncbi:MAG: hypothetical protein R2881_03370 [Eubacteriales bacterium]